MDEIPFKVLASKNNEKSQANSAFNSQDTM